MSSGLGRKSVAEQVGDKLKPESEKSTTERIGDTASGAYDRAAASVQPESQKSSTQAASDKVRGGSDEASGELKGVVESVKESAAKVSQKTKEALGINK